tara:strand:- start:1516 stop:3285 length:1770 start_codon:yes stop_codon:yes gene_type:complete
MNNGDFHIVNLSAYQTPEIVENPNEDFISYGEDNNYYKELIDAYLNSPTTGSIIQGISNQIYGKGVNAHDASKKPDEYAQMKSLFKKKCLQKIAMDLKLLGEAAFQVTYKNKKVDKVSHFNRETLRAEKSDDKGKINAYYYHPNWEEYKSPDELTRIPVFGSGSNNEIYIIRKFIPSMHYYSPPDWANALNYSKLECEISEYLVNEVQNSFSGTKLVSFSNGVPTQEKQHLIKNEIMNKLTGANGEKVIISFSDSPETKTSIEDISVSDAADVYSYIAEECSRKLLLANRITSPLLVGIRDTGNSLGSNAEEIENAHNLFENVVIKPYQELILDAVDDILAVNGIALDLYVETLTPIEFVNTEGIVTKEKREEETGEQLSLSKDLKNIESNAEILIDLGEDEDLENFELVDERQVDYDQEEALDKMLSLASTGTARPNANSDLDGETETGKKFIVRYQYAPLIVGKDTRDFCKKMVAAKKIYRKEDIIAMEDKAVNPGWGEGGKDKYSIWLYKGGGSCRHYWVRKTYMAKEGVKPDVKSPLTKPVYKQERAKEGISEPSKRKEPAKVSQRPRDMKNRGFIKDKNWTTPK